MKTLLILAMLLGCTCLHAQKVTYRYDNAGNRIERVINLSLRSAAGSSELTAIDDVVSTQDIKIYPNPTQGELSVEIPGFSDNVKGEIVILDINGRTLDRKQAASGKTHFDLTSHPSGIYLMKITVNGETITWKIIKE